MATYVQLDNKLRNIYNSDLYDMLNEPKFVPFTRLTMRWIGHIERRENCSKVNVVSIQKIADTRSLCGT